MIYDTQDILTTQVRYYVRAMNGTFKMPTPEEMTALWEEEKQERAARGYTKRQAHMMGPDQVIDISLIFTCIFPSIITYTACRLVLHIYSLWSLPTLRYLLTSGSNRVLFWALHY